MSSAVCSGLTVGSQQVLMSPGPLQIRNIPYSADTGTAGSCVLLAQAALPCALYCSAQGTTTALTRMHLTGGTDAELAPPIGYMQHVLLPMLKRLLAVDAGARLERRGFYPKGGGRVMLEVAPLSPDAGCVSATPLLHAGDCLSAFQMESRGSIEEVRVFSFSGGKEPEETAGLIAEGALSRLSERFPRVSSTTEHDALAKGSGSGAVVVARSEMGCILGASAIGGPRKPALEVGHLAAERLLQEVEHGGCTDQWMQDQLIVFMALARGRSCFSSGPITLHTVTAMRVAEQLTSARFRLHTPDGRTLSGKDMEEACTGGEAAATGRWRVECDSPGVPCRYP